MIKTAVATSTIKNSYQAGKEIGKKILLKTNDNPNLILLFATLDYEEYEGGLKNLLDGLYSVIPNNVKLAGGTVPGFLNNDGCYARGVTAFSINYPNMNIALGFGKNTKRSPKKAAKQAIKMIKNDLKNDYENKFIFSFISGPKNPNLPGVKSTNIINSKIKARILLSMFSVMQKLFQKGFGKEEEILEQIVKNLPDFNIIHSTTYSKPPFSENYQFYNNNLFDEHAVFLAIETDLKFDIDFATGAEETNKNLVVTKTNKNKTVIKKFDKNPAFAEFLKKMDWTYDILNDSKMTDISSRYPISYKKNNKIITRPPLMILGNYMGFLSKIEKENIFISKVTPNGMVNAVDEILKTTEPEFGFFSSCIARRDFLGIKIFQVQEKLKKYFKNKDFLLIYGAGEAANKIDTGFYFLNETITSAIFYKNIKK